MPELIILISAIVCAGSAIVLFFHRSSALAAGAAVLSFVTLLYGVGQRAERDSPQVSSPSSGDRADPRAAKPAGPAEHAKAKAPADVKETRAPQENLDAIGPRARQPPPPAPAGPQAALSTGVVISNFTLERAPPRHVVVSATLVNNNAFPVKNVVVRCGDKSYAIGDVTALVDKVVPARWNLQVAGLRMGPIRPELPPTICLVDRFERAD